MIIDENVPLYTVIIPYTLYFLIEKHENLQNLPISHMRHVVVIVRPLHPVLVAGPRQIRRCVAFVAGVYLGHS